jgi:beta-phosphoglucomutase family hydrolase
MPEFDEAHPSVFHPAHPSLPFIFDLALIFDMDGVMIDSMPVHEIAWRKYLESLGVADEDLLARMHGLRNDEIVLDFLGPSADLHSVREHGAAKERLYRQLMRDQLEQQLVPGIRQFLLEASDFPVGLASNAERPNIDFVLDGAGLRNYFQVIVDGSQVRHPKPAPDVYLRAARELGVEPRNCIVFEDSPVGIAAARAAGTRVVGLLTHERTLYDVDLAVTDFLDPELDRWLRHQVPEQPEPIAERPNK